MYIKSILLLYYYRSFTKFKTKIRRWTPFLISRRSEHVVAFYSNFCKRTKTQRKGGGGGDRNLGSSYLGNGWSDFLQIWNIDSPGWRATVLQIWFQSDKGSPRYKGVKMTFSFSFFLSIYQGVESRLLGRTTHYRVLIQRYICC